MNATKHAAFAPRPRRAYAQPSAGGVDRSGRGQQISGIQAATHESVDAIKENSGTIERLSEISSIIAAAVEEQGAATQEISRNVQQAAQGTQQVGSHITDVQRGASETGLGSSQVLSAAQMLSGDSNRPAWSHHCARARLKARHKPGCRNNRVGMAHQPRPAASVG